MSPEPNPTKVYETNVVAVNGNKMNSTEFVNTVVIKSSENCEQQTGARTTSTASAEQINDLLLKPPAHPREKRNVSPSIINLQDVFPDPLSPSSSSSTSQTTSANDATFEPTIEMMVNDFDDEQTLNEEEALAAMESQDQDEEINTLKEESEMPLEELLAKYRALPPMPPSFVEPPRKKSKKSSSSIKKKHKSKQKHEEITLLQQISNVEGNSDKTHNTDTAAATINAKDKQDVCILESGDDEKAMPDDDQVDEEDEAMVGSSSMPLKHAPTSSVEEERKTTIANKIVDEGGDVERVMNTTDTLKVRRSHLLDLYPEGTFDNVVVGNDAIAGNGGKDIPLDTLYGVEDDEDEEIEEEEDEDYKKKVMIGTTYQANIPHGLSLYGDILPYENEDKLIWEPSQVSEREVEEYLLKIRDIKSYQQGEDETASENNDESKTKDNVRIERINENLENNSLLANGDKLQVQTSVTADLDNQAVVKDNEQALHLLVQCGYDFKEALRRKRLNALPLNDCMSLWSEEECHKFEEGIQKYGKDFLKIRQNQVRTRTMRELVQFYYLWKKSERRDHNFANADTVDHMDIYLNEDNEYGSNPALVLTPVGSPVGTSSSTCTATRRNSNASQKNISIMSTTNINTNNTPSANMALDKSCSNTSSSQQQRRRASSTNNFNSGGSISNDFNSEHSSNACSNTTK